MIAEQLPSHLSSVLIVDDEPDICLALEDLLRHEGHTVRSVTTGREALHQRDSRVFAKACLIHGALSFEGW
jgi:DNA-binding NtrC family response regulator